MAHSARDLRAYRTPATRADPTRTACGDAGSEAHYQLRRWLSRRAIAPDARGMAAGAARIRCRGAGSVWFTVSSTPDYPTGHHIDRRAKRPDTGARLD